MYHNSGDLVDRPGYDLGQVGAIAKVTMATLLHGAGFEVHRDGVDDVVFQAQRVLVARTPGCMSRTYKRVALAYTRPLAYQDAIHVACGALVQKTHELLCCETQKSTVIHGEDDWTIACDYKEFKGVICDRQCEMRSTSDLPRSRSSCPTCISSTPISPGRRRPAFNATLALSASVPLPIILRPYWIY